MKIKTKVFSAVALATSVLVSSVAYAGFGGGAKPLYIWNYYSDASKTSMVGTKEQHCWGGQVETYIEGTITAYSNRYSVGWCGTE